MEKEKTKNFFEKMLSVKVIAFLFLITVNIVFRLVYKLPFVNRQRKRFDKEVKPLFQIKSAKKTFVTILAMNLISPFLTVYIVNLLIAFIDFVKINFSSVKSLFSSSIDFSMFSWQLLSYNNLFNFSTYKENWIVSAIVNALIIILITRIATKNFRRLQSFNHNQDGDDRFATLGELERQYKKIPNKVESFDGYGGVPVAHILKPTLSGLTLKVKILFANRYFSDLLSSSERCLNLDNVVSGYYLIEDDTINCLFVGTTRSGKDQTVIDGMVDNITRGRKRSSMALGDPKGELYQSYYDTLKKRGYDVAILNLQNMDYSMSVNLLQPAIDSAKKGYSELTQQRVAAVSEAIYRKAKEVGGNERFWEDTSISLFNAIAMAIIDRAKETEKVEKNSWETVTVRNIANFLTYYGSKQVVVDYNDNIIENPTPQQMQTLRSISMITYYFSVLRKVNEQKFSKFREMAYINFQTSDFSSEETKGNVYTSLMAGVKLFLEDNIAKLTSKNTFDIASLGCPRRLSLKIQSSSNIDGDNLFKYSTAYIEFFNQKNKALTSRQAVLIDEQGYLTYVIEPTLPNKFKVKISFNHPENSQELKNVEVYINCEKQFKTKTNKRGKRVFIRDKYTHDKVLASINCDVNYNLENVSNQIKPIILKSNIDFAYSEKPIALFLVTPPQSMQYNSVVSLYVDQIFNINYEMALNSGRKLPQRIHFIFNEFTNLPPIPNMQTKISIGLSSNMLFTMFIQNLEQLTERYGEETAKTIMGNCSINGLIKTTSEETNKQYSAMLGKKTIDFHQKTGSTEMFMPNVHADGITVMQTTKGQELLTPSQLSKLQAGEMVIVRGVKARDLKGRKVTPDPIFVKGKTELPYQYMFLANEFKQNKTLSDIPVESEHRGLDLKTISLDYVDNINKLYLYFKELSSDSAESTEHIFLRSRQHVLTKEEQAKIHGLSHDEKEEQGKSVKNGFGNTVNREPANNVNF